MIARHRIATLLCVAFLLALPLALFFSVTFGNATLLPVDNLFAWQPFKSLAGTFGIIQPHNSLLSDLILENYPWKRFIIESIQQGEIPLWNPYLFGGIPFLAAGQHSALYPFSILYYVLPLEKAYGWFTVLNLGLAGVFFYLFMRVLGFRRASATLAGVAYELSGFMIVSVVFPMIIAAAAWLPLILMMCELIIRQAPGLRGRPATVPWVVIGAIAVTLHILAGHIEITVYTAIIVGFYCIWRLVSLWHTQKLPVRSLLRPAGGLALMALLGAGMGAIQLMPLYEVVQTSFRTARSSLAQVMSYGFPVRNILLWLMPNFYGNPAQHTYFDLFSWSTQTLQTANGNTDWGIKDYVERGVYVGVITLLLAGVAVVRYVLNLISRRRKPSAPASPNAAPTGFFIVLGLLSVGFIFGTYLYAILFYGLPGINQLNSPFRWKYALTLCLAALAGMGLDWLISHFSQHSSQPSRGADWLKRFAIAGLGAGTLMLAGLVIVRAFWAQFSSLVTRVYSSLAAVPAVFPTVESFFSYEASSVFIFALLLIAGCILLILARRYAARAWWSVLVIGLLAVDLNVAWFGFNPSTDPKLLQATPGALQFLQQDKSQWRLTTYEPSGGKPLNANAAWLYHLQDVRGYDSIIPRQYANYMELIEPQNDLLYNRIAPLYHDSSLESPLLDLLGVKYVLTEQTVTINTPGFKQVYEGDGVRIYQNERVMPRAFTLPASSALLTNDFASAVQTYDPRKYVMIDATCGITDTGCTIPHAASYTPANITSYKNNEVWVDAQITETSWLILGDSYYPGWRAWIRPLGGSNAEEHEVQIGLANGNFRTIRLDMPTSTVSTTSATGTGTTLGQQPALGDLTSRPTSAPQAVAYTIRFKYSPDSVRIGAFTSFITLVVLLLIAGVYAWRLVYSDSMASSPVRRIAKNSLVLTGFNLVGRLIDLAFAVLMLRVLGPDGAGKYSFAIVIIGWFDILTNFGLNTFLMREVARDRDHANKYLYNTTILRLLLGFGSAPLIAIIIIVWRSTFGMSDDTALAIVFLAIGQVISSMSTGLSALFFAYEKSEVPATLSIVGSLIKVTLGTLALLAGFGIVGLAGVAIITNLVTVIVLLIATVRVFFVPRSEGDPAMRRAMMRESFPLMLNHLLATLFFKVDVPLLEAMKSATVVGWYSTAYKYVDAFGIIPAFFTQSIFPAMSRLARQDSDSMAHAYVLSLKLLVMLALPIAVGSTALAPYMIGLLGGSEYLPHGGIALQIMIWSIPFGWINSITNYALIAVNQQRALTRAFVIGLVFNIVANLIFIPMFSYQAAAAITILSEVVEGSAFYFYVRRHIARVPWLDVLGRPALCAAVMGAVIYFSALNGLLIPGVILGSALYIAGLIVIRVLSPTDRMMLAPLIPARFRGSATKPEKA